MDAGRAAPRPNEGSPGAAAVLRRLIAPFYIPTFLTTVGMGMLIPVLPLYLRDVGLSYGSVSVVLAAAGLGGVAGQIPVGSIIGRVGVLRVVVAATFALGASTALLGVTTSVAALTVFRVAAGFGNAGWSLSRQTYLSLSVPSRVRGRASAGFGGVLRFAWLVGPVAGGAAAEHLGFTEAFVLTGLVMLAGLAPVAGRGARAAMPPPVPPRDDAGFRRVVRDHRQSLMSAGSVLFLLAAVREGRVVVIPLIGAAMGLDVADVGILVAIGAATDLLLFPLAGWLMDRYTRLAASVPAVLLLAAGLFVIAAADTTGALVVGAAVAGVGNGIGAGIMLAVGADIAPRHDAGRFLALFGLTREAGRFAGPLLVGLFAATASLSAAAAALGVLAILVAALFIGVLGDTSDAAPDALRP